MNNSHDTWLTDSDINRLWKVINGELSEDYCTVGEIEELQGLIAQIIDKEYPKPIIH